MGRGQWHGVVIVAATISCTQERPVGADASDTGATEASSGTGGDSGTADPSTSATTTTGGSSATSDTDSTVGETDAAPFEHELYTLITEDGRLALHSNLPPTVEACMDLAAADPPCEDLDADTLVDAWEDAVLDRLRPLRRFDEAEQAVNDDAAVFADVGRVFEADDGSFRLFVMLGYSRDYGSCGGLSAHNGDSERVALDLAALPGEGAGGLVMQRAYTAAHEGTVNDHGQVFTGADLDLLVLSPDPETAEPRWTVFPSADKHATYATIEICEGISVVPCLDEDCGPDGVADPAAFDLLPVAANAGELDTPRLTDLSELGFPGDDAWADQEFCGGLGGVGCSSSVREKLLNDPFP